MSLEEIAKQVEQNRQQLDNNAEKINTNVNNINKNFEQIIKNSGALDLLTTSKSESKRLFIILIIVLVMWFATIGYLVYVLNDIGTYDERIIDIEDVETIDNSHIKIGDDVWEKSK